jgi:phosphate starvation-inducible PhoH-like protein
MKSVQFELEPFDNERIACLCGNMNSNLHLIEYYMAVEIIHRGHTFKIIGPKTAIQNAKYFIEDLYKETQNQSYLEENEIKLALQAYKSNNTQNIYDFDQKHIIRTSNHTVKGRTINQERYLKRIQYNDINFGIGPAGTGKTYLAVARAVEALENKKVKRILLVRPAVEAGENLGFLPGDLAQKVDPYLRPMYDALYDLMGVEKVSELIEKQIIELAPLAFMRGRTLNDSFIILDESQNTTKEQMKMFLTRIGFNSKAVVTGDITQVDLPYKVTPGLRHAIEVLSDIDNISMTFFESEDVVRHPLVQAVVSAYEDYERNYGSVRD